MAYLVAAATTSLGVVGSIPLRINFFCRIGKSIWYFRKCTIGYFINELIIVSSFQHCSSSFANSAQKSAKRKKYLPARDSNHWPLDLQSSRWNTTKTLNPHIFFRKNGEQFLTTDSESAWKSLSEYVLKTHFFVCNQLAYSSLDKGSGLGLGLGFSSICSRKFSSLFA